jgi:hypothetical protein
MLDAYIERRSSPPLFFSSFFRVSPRSFHNSEFIEVDIRRGEPHIAIPVPSVTSGARKYEASLYENRKFKPPVYDTEAGISAWTTSLRRPGVDPFQDVDFRRAALDEAFLILGDLEDMTRRSVELQASQILQTGVVDLRDKTGTVIYTLDFGARPSHFVTTTPWAADGNSGDPFADIDALATELRTHGKLVPTDLAFGTLAWTRFLANAKVKSVLDILGLQSFSALAGARPARPGSASFRGTMTIGYYEYRLWLYDDFYIDPQTLEPTRYLSPSNVLMIADEGRRDLTFGSFPMFVPPEARAAQFLPARMSSVEGGFDMTTNIWVTPDGKHLTMSAGTRPLCVPTALDTFGTLTVA